MRMSFELCGIVQNISFDCKMWMNCASIRRTNLEEEVGYVDTEQQNGGTARDNSETVVVLIWQVAAVDDLLPVDVNPLYGIVNSDVRLCAVVRSRNDKSYKNSTMSFRNVSNGRAAYLCMLRS